MEWFFVTQKSLRWRRPFCSNQNQFMSAIGSAVNLKNHVRPPLRGYAWWGYSWDDSFLTSRVKLFDNQSFGLMSFFDALLWEHELQDHLPLGACLELQAVSRQFWSCQRRLPIPSMMIYRKQIFTALLSFRRTRAVPDVTFVVRGEWICWG